MASPVPAPAASPPDRRRAVVGLAVATAGAAAQSAVGADNWVGGGFASLGVAGLIVAGSAIARRPKDATTLALAAATGVAAYFSAHHAWGSVRLLFGVLTALAACSAILVQLPRTAQLAAVSLLILYHFAGILSAITSPPPTPWLTTQFWVRVFRPYLEFCYINNAYQFYSPEPGPANLLWFCLTETNDAGETALRWVRVPEKGENLDPLLVQYYRRLSLTERVNQNDNFPLGPPAEMLLRRKMVETDIPFHPEAAWALQFRMPDENSRQFIASYAKYVAAARARPGWTVKSLKVYLTQHRLMSKQQYAQGRDPYDKEWYLPFFVGEFDPTGRIHDPFDPMLYWLVPIVKVSRDGQPAEYKNYVLYHAGSDPFEE